MGRAAGARQAARRPSTDNRPGPQAIQGSGHERRVAHGTGAHMSRGTVHAHQMMADRDGGSAQVARLRRRTVHLPVATRSVTSPQPPERVVDVPKRVVTAVAGQAQESAPGSRAPPSRPRSAPEIGRGLRERAGSRGRHGAPRRSVAAEPSKPSGRGQFSGQIDQVGGQRLGLGPQTIEPGLLGQPGPSSSPTRAGMSGRAGEQSRGRRAGGRSRVPSRTARAGRTSLESASRGRPEGPRARTGRQEPPGRR